MPKSTITLILNTETIQSFTTHDTVESLNETYWAQINANSANLTKTEREIYYKLSQYAVKYPGVAYLSANSIAKMVECSRATVMRAFKKLRTLNMIEILNAKRKSDNRQTANIIRMLPVVMENATVEQGKNEAIDSSNTETPENNASIEKPVANQAKSNAESKVIAQDATQDATQGTGENETPLSSFSLSTSKSLKDLKTFDTGECRALEVLNAFNIDQSLIRSIQPLALSATKQVELLNGGIVTHLQIALSRKFAAFMRNFDILAHLDAIQSAAIRTAFVAKRKQIRNPVGYFLKTLTTLIDTELAELATDIAVEAAEIEGYSGYDAVVYAKREGKSLAQGSALERVLSIIDEHFGITNQTNTEVS